MSLKTLSLLAGAVMGLAAATPASAITYVYAASLSGLTENPPNASPGTGVAAVAFDTTTLTVSVTEFFSGLTAPTTASHIHCCAAPPTNASVALAFTGFTTGVTSGIYSNSFTLGSTAFYTMLTGAAAGQAYVNVHTTAFAGGEIEGYLQGPTAVVPEPGTYALMLAGLGAVGFIVRKRQA